MDGYSPKTKSDFVVRWKILPVAVGLAAWIGVFGGLVPARLAIAAEPQALAEHIPLDEITPGMQGFGLTVFQGTVVDTFAVTVIGVQKNVRAAGSLLLIEVSGHGLEESSIAQGMSGSPIFLDGRFAGALAFGWGGALRPIAGVTPAAEMLALPTDVPQVARPRGQMTVIDTADLVPHARGMSALAQEIWGQDAGAPPAASEADHRGGDWPDPQRMWLHLARQLAGSFPQLDVSPDQWLFQSLGAAAGGSTTANPAREEAPLRPGSACAVPLVIGDASLGAIGTVTWVDGDKVLMMGHPFMQRGPVNMPLATARVLTIFPSREMSFKMGSIGQVVGAVHYDLRAGLSGRIGPVPRMVPVSVVVAGRSGRTYHFEVVDDPFLTPTLVFWSLYNALLVTGDDASQQTVRYEMETVWSGDSSLAGAPLQTSGIATGPQGAAGLAREVMSPLSILLNNSYAEVHLQEVRLKLTRTRPVMSARVVGLTSPQTVVRPGQKVIFQAEIEPFQGQRETLAFPVTIPVQMGPGRYRVVVASAADLFALESRRAAGRFEPSNLPDILEILRSSRGRDELVLAIFAPGRAMILQGQELRNLPHSVARTVRTGNVQAKHSLADYIWRSSRATPWILSGYAARGFRVQDQNDPLTVERRP